MKKILVVDNHPVVLKLMGNLLKKEGHQVLTAEDGLSALDILKNFTPDVIFVDMVMPNISGEKLCRIIRGIPKLKHVYLIILSATAGEEEVKFAEFGANACIAKGPFKKTSEHILAILDQSNQGAVDFEGKTIGLEDVYPREITKELLSAKNHFEAIINTINEGILELTLDAKVFYANPTASSLIGIPEEKLLSANFINIFQESDRERISELLEATVDSPQKITEDSPVILNKKQLSLDMLKVNDDMHQSLIVVLNDVSARKRMEAQLRQAQKMEALGTLAGGIAHNFNNILMGIQGNASLLLLETDSAYPFSKRLKTIEKLIQNGSKLTGQLLVYAREGRYEVRIINLSRLVKETSDTFSTTKREIRVHKDLAEDLCGIKADQGQIEQVLLNLYINAADAMPKGGDLFLKTRTVTHREMRGKPYKPRPGNYVLLKVRDTGVGMDRKTKDRIFDPFFTTKGLANGTGLGLASAYGILKGHGGFIDAESEKRRGTTFSIYLPAVEEEVNEEKAFSSQMMKGNGTVLLVDDEDMVRDAGGQMLKQLGYDVLLASGGQEALDLYLHHQGRIDMILLDMIMPDLGGGETYDRIKEMNSGVKVLLSSGYGIDGEAREILKRGCNEFIQKPFNIMDLSQKVNEILNHQ